MGNLRNDLGDLLKASYKPQKEAKSTLEKKKYRYDDKLSSMNTKVFVDDTDTPVIVHRGTTTAADMFDDALVAVGLGKYGHRYKNAQRITKKVEDKYGKAANSVGHSYGGYLSENSGAKGNIITYNKAAGLGDIGTKKNNRQLDVRTKGDVVSILSKTQTANTETIEKKKPTKNVVQDIFDSHSTDNLFH
jgi:hypothetical protein